MPAPQTGNANAGAASDNLAQIEALQSETVARLRDSWGTAAWALNQDLTFPYDEIALDGNRVAIIETLLSRLNATGYQGTVAVQTHVGEFCLQGDQENGFRLPPPDLPLDQCDFVGNPVQAADTPAAHQSLGFANFMNSTPLLADKGITVNVTTLPRTQALIAYPPKDSATALTWNQAAAANNRVIIQLQP